MTITFINIQQQPVFKVTISCSRTTLAVLKFIWMDSMQILKCTNLTSCFLDV